MGCHSFGTTDGPMRPIGSLQISSDEDTNTVKILPTWDIWPVAKTLFD